MPVRIFVLLPCAVGFSETGVRRGSLNYSLVTPQQNRVNSNYFMTLSILVAILDQDKISFRPCNGQKLGRY